MIKDFKFLNTTKQLSVPTGYVPYIHVPREELAPGYRRLSFCEYPITFSVDYEGFSFVWEPRDSINNQYRIASWSGPLKDFKRHYENRRMSLGNNTGEDWLPCYPRIRRIYIGTDDVIIYNTEPRFTNPRFIFNHEFVRIEYKQYEDR